MKANTLLALAASAVLAAPIAEARITKIEIDVQKSESPTFGGFSWPGVGQYEKIVGKASGEVNPHDRQNRMIVDIEFAPTNSRGNVEYSFNFYILKPIDLNKGSRKMMYEPPNRGGKTWTALGRVAVPAGANGDDPGSSITDRGVLANSFLMPRGYTISWSGWEDLGSLDNPNFNASANFPIAKFPPTAANPTGTITGPSYEYIVVGNTTTSSVALSYPAATLDKGKATLTHRVHLNDAPQVIPASGWNYNAAGTSISLVGANFVPNDIYEFAYTAKDPKVNGLGFAAVRDWMDFLRYERRDDSNNPNPLAGYVKRVYTEISSQPGRLLNDFRHLGFNETESGKKAFDGHMQWIAAGNGINMNYRFSQSGRTERNRQNHLYIEGRFPFANVRTFDPITRKSDSRYASCEDTKTCPLGMEIYSANEYWVKAAALLHTTPDGRRDLPDSEFTRNYFMSSMRHGTAASPSGSGTLPSPGLCQQPDNPLNSAPVQRALFIALDEWATKDKEPPRSRVPKLKDGTLAAPLPQSGMGFPNIPGVTYTGLKTTRYHFDYGLNFYETGIATINPPTFPFTTPSYQDDPRNGPIYPSFIPKTDSDGNDIAGVRLADVTVPLATYTGWALRRGAQANDGCEAAGQFIPFAKTDAERGGDPRPSVAARYSSFAVYHAKVRSALNEMVSDRLLLCEDAGTEEARLMQAGVTRGVPPPAGGVLPAVTLLAACEPKKHQGRNDHDDDRDDD
jgi:Alpha/beta hydrolase domain